MTDEEPLDGATQPEDAGDDVPEGMRGRDNDLDEGVVYTQVSSSNIHSIGYRPDNHTLFIRFKDKVTGEVKSRYVYYNVYTEIYRDLMAADSHGKYLAAHVKGRLSYQEF